MVEIRRVPASETFALRHRVLRPHVTIDEVALPGDDDADTGHFAAYDESGNVIGTATVRRESPPEEWGEPEGWRLRGMATEESLRGQGIGAAVLGAAIAHVAEHGGGLFWCNARMSALTFYERAGFVTRGEMWVDPDIGPHIRMWRRVDPAD
ncbi:MAG TPA: GNAT family N-acetyltransferase [Acidimicrobiales bacterium]|nr:GNAT family N-acetyltransferase [Acidimicrobiales bacterium]